MKNDNVIINWQDKNMFEDVFSVLSNSVKEQQDNNHLEIFEKVFSVLSYLIKKWQCDSQLTSLRTCSRIFFDF